jgi:aspartokinase/homoserine dehydrogenase 1
MATLVMKFGGSLTADAEHLSRVAQVIVSESEAWNRLVVVVSAKRGATDTLNEAVNLAAARNAAGYRRAIATLRDEHLHIIRALFQDELIRKNLIDHVDRCLFDALAVCDRALSNRTAIPRDRDEAMAVGEKIMVNILTSLLRQEGLRAATVDAETLIITDSSYQNAHPMVDLIDERVERFLRPLLEVEIIPVIAGFVGATQKGVITTLGRGGSDYTATLLAASLRADEVWMWTRVDGVMSTDPRLVPGARVISVLSYEEVGELSYFGARVLHPDAIEPLAQRGIPLRVRNPNNLDHAGTLIQAEDASGDQSGPALKAVTAVDGLYLSMSGQPLEIIDFLSQIHHLVGNVATGPVIVTQSHHNATLVFVVPTSEGPGAMDNALQRLRAALPRWEIQPVKVIAAIGASAILRATVEVPLLASALGPGNRRLIAVSPADAKEAVRQLHKLTESNAESAAPPFWPQKAGHTAEP